MLKSEDLVSVVVPAYNIENYIKKCLDSLVNQTYKNLEILVIDDGSTDGTGRICDEVARKDERVKVFHRTNEGLSEARNFGISKARGEYVALVDGDDYVDEDFVKDMWEAIEEAGADIAICGYNTKMPRRETILGREAVKRLLIQQENMEIVAWNKLYRRRVIGDIKYPKGEKYEDTLTTYKILAWAEEVVYVDKALYHYVVREGSIMGASKTEERLAARERAAEEAIDYFKDEDLKKAAEVGLLLAKYAWIDAVLQNEVSKKYLTKNLKWVKENRERYASNEMMTRKLKLYNRLVQSGTYKAFRKLV